MIRSSLSKLFGDAIQRFQFFSLVRQASAFAVSIMLARSHFSLVDVGTFELWLFLGLILTFLVYSGTLQAFLREYHGKGNHRDAIIFNIFLLQLLLAVICGGSIYVFKNQLSGLGLDKISNLGWVLFYLWLHLSASLTPYIFLAKNFRHFFIPYAIFYFVGYGLAVLIPLLGRGGLPEVLLGLIVFALIEYLILLIAVFRYSIIKLAPSLIRILSRVAIPLTIYGGLGLLAQIFDAWLVQWYYDDLGVFAKFRYGARELPGALAIAGAFSSSLLLLARRDLAGGKIRTYRGSLRLMHLFFPITIILMLTSPFLFSWIFGPDFVTSSAIFNTYLLLMIARWIFPHALIIALREEKVLVQISVVELLMNISLSIVLVSIFGLVGVALATVFAFLGEKLMLIFFLYKKYQLRWGAYIPLRTWWLYSATTVICYLFATFWFDL